MNIESHLCLFFNGIISLRSDTHEKTTFFGNINMVSVLNERIDLGETEAIALAFEKKADFIILDDSKARKTA